jgi:spore coat polysaccharide biosynthesis protein SpsF
MSSTRLPGKVLLPLGDTTVLGQVIRRVLSFSDQAIVCTSTDPTDDPIEAHSRSLGVRCHRGSLDNVFLRFRTALAHAATPESHWFFRVTADCPLVSGRLAENLLSNADASDDYLCYRPEDLPRGLSSELVKRETFESVEPGRLDPPERQHVTLHLYEKPGRFNVRWVDPPEAFRHPSIRLTLDYEEDYELFRRLFDLDDTLDAEDAITHILSDPSLRAINDGCVQRSPR